jgi:hypothetical protein
MSEREPESPVTLAEEIRTSHTFALVQAALLQSRDLHLDYEQASLAAWRRLREFFPEARPGADTRYAESLIWFFLEIPEQREEVAKLFLADPETKAADLAMLAKYGDWWEIGLEAATRLSRMDCPSVSKELFADVVQRTQRQSRQSADEVRKLAQAGMECATSTAVSLIQSKLVKRLMGRLRDMP